MPHHVTLEGGARRAHLGTDLAAEAVRVVNLEPVVGIQLVFIGFFFMYIQIVI